MKTITLENDDEWSDKTVLAKIIGEAPVGSSYRIEEVRQACKIIDKVEAAETTLALEDAEYAFVKDRITKQQWVRATPQIVAFVDRVMAV